MSYIWQLITLELSTGQRSTISYCVYCPVFVIIVQSFLFALHRGNDNKSTWVFSYKKPVVIDETKTHIVQAKMAASPPQSNTFSKAKTYLTPRWCLSYSHNKVTHCNATQEEKQIQKVLRKYTEYKEASCRMCPGVSLNSCSGAAESWRGQDANRWTNL